MTTTTQSLAVKDLDILKAEVDYDYQRYLHECETTNGDPTFWLAVFNAARRQYRRAIQSYLSQGLTDLGAHTTPNTESEIN